MINQFAKVLTPKEYFALDQGREFTLEELERRARRGGKCIACRTEDKWRLGGSGMCFPCTTGESDPSNDYEIRP